MITEVIHHQDITLQNLDSKTVDLNRYLNWLKDPEVNQYLEIRHAIPKASELIDYIDAMNASEQDLLMGIFVQNAHVGNIKLGPINSVHKKGIIGLLVGEKSHWGRGVATQAITAITQFALKELNLHRLEACCYADNVGSQRAFIKAGYVEEGRFRQAWLTSDGYQDNIWFGYVK